MAAPAVAHTERLGQAATAGAATGGKFKQLERSLVVWAERHEISDTRRLIHQLLVDREITSGERASLLGLLTDMNRVRVAEAKAQPASGTMPREKWQTLKDRAADLKS